MKRNDVSQDQMINYVLGELSSRQAKKLEKFLVADPELKAECDQLRELLGETTEIMKRQEGEWSLGAARHLEILGQTKTTKKFDLSLFLPMFFTRTRMVELGIVLVVLAGFLASLVTVVSGRLKSARVKQAKIAMAEMGKALDMFYTDCGFYPSKEQGLQALLEAPKKPPLCSGWGPDPYIKKVPRDPWNHQYIYESEGKAYVLKSKGKDGSEGGSGEDEDISSEDL